MTLGVALALSFSMAVSASSSSTKSKSKPAPAAPAPAPAPAPEPAPTPEVSAKPVPAPAPVAAAPAPAAPPSASDGKNLRIGVVDFQSAQDQQGLAGAVAGFVANELQRLGAFQVTTTDQIRQMLTVERQAQLLGCPDDSCRGQAVVSLGFDEIVTGKLTKLSNGKGGGTLTLELVLISEREGRREASDVSTASTEAELMGRVSPSVVKLVSVLLKARSGGLVLSSSEAGATVKVDDVIVGTTPVGQTTVAGGPHVVAVEKEGFVTWQKEVRITPELATEEQVRLQPSPDFINAWHGRQTRLRIGAWTSTVIAAGGLITCVVMGLRAQTFYGDVNTPHTFQYERNLVVQGDETWRDGANQLKATVETARTVAYVGAGVAAVGAIAAAAFWVISDNPNKYDVYKAVDVKTSVSAFAAPGQGGIAISGSF
jgi:hypothetical protein